MLATASGRPVTQTEDARRRQTNWKLDSAASRPGKLPGFRDQDSDFRNEDSDFRNDDSDFRNQVPDFRDLRKSGNIDQKVGIILRTFSSI